MLLDGLPSMGSAYHEARRNAPETVERVLSLPEDGSVQWHPPATEWTLRDELTATLVDRVGLLLAVEQAKGTGRAARVPPPFPRPVRAVDLARSAMEREYLEELEDEVAEAQARWLAQQEREGDANGEC